MTVSVASGHLALPAPHPFFPQAAELYKRGDGKEARRLADEGQLLDTQMKQMHAQAADALFTSRQGEP